MKRFIASAMILALTSILILTIDKDAGTSAASLSDEKNQQPPNTSHELLGQLTYGTVEGIAWHPSQDIFAVVGSGGLTIYDSSFHLMTYLDEPIARGSDLAWSPDGTKLAIRDVAYIAIWDYPTLQLVTRVNESGLSPVAWSSDGQYLAAADYDTIHIIDSASGNILNSLQKSNEAIYSFAWGPTNLLGGHTDANNIYIWDIFTEQIVTTFYQAGARLRSIAWDWTNNRIATATDQAKIVIWNPATGDILKEFSSLDLRPLPYVFWHPNGTLISVDYDGRTDSWDVSSSEPTSMMLLAPQDNSFFWQVVINATGSRLAGLRINENIPTNDYIVHIWDISNPQAVQMVTSLLHYSGSVTQLSWSPDDALLGSASGDTHLRVWAFADQRLVVRAPFYVWDTLYWDSDWSQVAGLNENGEFQTIWHWDPSVTASAELSFTLNLDVAGELSTPAHRSSMLLWDNINHQVIDIQHDGTVWLWADNAGWEVIASFETNVRLSDGAALSDDGRYLALSGLSNNDETMLLVLDLHTEQLVTVVQGQDYRLGPIAWSPDGSLIASNGETGINIWDWDASTPLIKVLSQPEMDYRMDLAWHPTTTLLAVIGIDLWIWDVDAGQLIERIETGRYADLVKWSHSGDKLATGGYDGTIRVWEVQLNDLPSSASLASPTGTIPDPTPTYTWHDVPTATEFKLTVENAAGSVLQATYPRTVCSDGTCAVTPTTALLEGDYAWTIQTINAAGDGPVSQPLTFTVDLCVYIPDASVSTLITQIQAANASGQPTQLCLAPDSTYTLTAPLPEITGNITIIGNGATIRRDPANPNKFRLMNIKNTATVTLENLTLENGYAVGVVGGAIGSNGVVTLRNVHLLNNVSTLDGGAIGNYHTLTIENSELRGNRGNRGGAVFNGSGGTLTITESILADNQAMPDNGQPNSNNIGGAIANYGVLTITDSQILNNRATLSTGGGIYTRGNTIVHGSCIHNNADTAVVYTTPDPPVAQDFTNNWWGTVDGPRGPDLTGSGDKIGSNITFQPFITTQCEDIPVLGSTALYSPPSGATLVDLEVTFEWAADPAATKYELKVTETAYPYKDPVWEILVVDEDITCTGETCRVTYPVHVNGNLTWQVRVGNEASWSEWSESRPLTMNVAAPT